MPVISPPDGQRLAFPAAAADFSLRCETQPRPQASGRIVVPALQGDPEPIRMPLADRVDQVPRNPGAPGAFLYTQMRQPDHLTGKREQRIADHPAVMNGSKQSPAFRRLHEPG